MNDYVKDCYKYINNSNGTTDNNANISQTRFENTTDDEKANKILNYATILILFPPINNLPRYINRAYRIETPINLDFIWIFRVIGLLLIIYTCIRYPHNKLKNVMLAIGAWMFIVRMLAVIGFTKMLIFLFANQGGIIK